MPTHSDEGLRTLTPADSDSSLNLLAAASGSCDVATVTLIVLAYNEEKLIRGTLDTIDAALQPHRGDFKVVVADDGSTDCTAQIVLDYSRSNSSVRLDSSPKNCGIGATLLRIVPRVESEFFMVVPGDGDLNAQSIAALYASRQTADVVIGYFQSRKHRPWHRRGLSWIFSRMASMLTSTRVRYVNGPSIYRTSVVRDIDLRSTGFLSIFEFNVKAVHQAKTYAELLLESPPIANSSGGSLSRHSLVECIQMVAYFLSSEGMAIRRKSHAERAQ